MAEKDLDNFIVGHLDGNPLFNKVHEAVKEAGIDVSDKGILMMRLSWSCFLYVSLIWVKTPTFIAVCTLKMPIDISSP